MMKSSTQFFTPTKLVLATAITSALSVNAYAATCAANSTSIGGACEDFQITTDIAATPPGTVAVGAAITASTGGPYATSLTNPGIVTNFNVNAGGSITGGTVAAFANGGAIENLTINSGASITASSGQNAIRNVYVSGSTSYGYINNIYNYGSIIATGGKAINNSTSLSTINNIYNYGTINGSVGIDLVGNVNNVINSSSGVISGGVQLYNSVITKLDNSGQINGTIGVTTASSGISTLNNSGQINGRISNAGIINTLNNTGKISGGSSLDAIYLQSGSVISTLNNSGLIESTDPSQAKVGINMYGTSRITTLTNTATTYTAGVAGISNIVVDPSASIGTINNAQKGLNYLGKLPSYYNIIVNSQTSYGRLDVVDATAGTSKTKFGIYNTSTLLGGTTYSSVMSGVSLANFTGATNGYYNGLAWKLAAGAANSVDLVTATEAHTQATAHLSVQSNTAGLANVMNTQVAAMQAGLTYDCNKYDEYNLCASAGGRYTYASPSENAQAALLILGYRPMDTLRVGAFADQSVNISTPTGYVQSKSQGPMWGLYANWNLKKDGTGLGVQASAVTAASALTVSRQQQQDFTEPGSGTTQMTGQGYRLTANYHYPLTPATQAVPYGGLQYTRVNNGAYTENSNAFVSSPLSYNAMAQNTLAAVAGLGVKSLLAEKLTGTASVGIQQNLNYNMGNLQGTSNIAGFQNFSVQMPGNINSMATASAGIYYDIRKSERVGVNVLWQQQPFINTNTTTALATYTIGF